MTTKHAELVTDKLNLDLKIADLSATMDVLTAAEPKQPVTREYFVATNLLLVMRNYSEYLRQSIEIEKGIMENDTCE